MLFNGHNQAKKVCILKTISRREWKNQPGGAGFSPRRPYCCPLPSPVSLSLFSFPSCPLHIYIIYRCICIYVYTYIRIYVYLSFLSCSFIYFHRPLSFSFFLILSRSLPIPTLISIIFSRHFALSQNSSHLFSCRVKFSFVCLTLRLENFKFINIFATFILIE